MKKFNEWLSEKHPEIIDEGILDSLGKNKFVRRGVAGLGLAAGAAGLYRAGHDAGSATSNRTTMQQSSGDEFDSEKVKLPGTYEAGIRTFDEKGRELPLTPEQQKMVNSIRKIRERMGGSGGATYKKKSASSDEADNFLNNKPETVHRKSRSNF